MPAEPEPGREPGYFTYYTGGASRTLVASGNNGMVYVHDPELVYTRAVINVNNSCIVHVSCSGSCLTGITPSGYFINDDMHIGRVLAAPALYNTRRLLRGRRKPWDEARFHKQPPAPGEMRGVHLGKGNKHGRRRKPRR